MRYFCDEADKLQIMEPPEYFNSIFEPALLDEISRTGKVLKVDAGDTIVDFGQSVKTMPIILTGSVKVSRMDESGRELLLYYLNPKESCAMTFTCCMEHIKSEIRAVAEEPVELIAIPTTVMDEWLVKYPTWKAYVMQMIRVRFNEMLKTIDQIAFQKLDERLVTYLKEKSKNAGSTLLNVSHEQIANDLATTRVVVSRLLKKLENEDKLLLYRNQIKLLNTF